MVLNKEIVLIHGTWCDGNVWGEFATGLRQMGYKVHTPSFRYHDLPYQECLAKVGTVTLQDYRDDLVALIESLDQPPTYLGTLFRVFSGSDGCRKNRSSWYDSHGTSTNSRYFCLLSNHVSLFWQTLFTLGILEKSHASV